MKLKKTVAISAIRRTPFAQICKGLGSYPSHHLGLAVAEDILKTGSVAKEEIDGVIVGEGQPFQPNPARVIANLLKLPDQIPALTVCNNCVSSLDAVAEACRRLELEEGQLFLVLGEESQSNAPFVVQGARNNKKTASLERLLKLLPDNLPEGVEVRDSLEDGLGDGETSYGMHVTAEVVAQNWGISRETSDKVAYQSFKRAYDATQSGKYAPFLVAMKETSSDNGKMLQEDESVILRKGIVENPSRMEKAMLLFDNPGIKFEDFKKKYSSSLTKTHGPTVSIFNACPRSDGASGALVSTMEEAQRLGLKPQGKLIGFCMKGVSPNVMGIGQAEASLSLLEELDLKIEDIDQIEIHEAFAATAIGALEEIKKRSGLDWEKKFDAGRINAYGGSIAIGHPFGATGLRLLGNAAMVFQNEPTVNRVLVTACAHGGVAGAFVIERP